MKLVMVYREASERRLEVETFLNGFKRQTGREIETKNPDSREGADFCRTYDVVAYPTLIAITDDGTPISTWSDTLPTISDASFYK